MENEKEIRFGPYHPLWNEAQSLEATVRAVRKARGMLNPEDCEPGSSQQEQVTMDFLRDVMRAMGEDPDADEDTESDGFGVGASG
jgi:hypothetical protein